LIVPLLFDVDKDNFAAVYNLVVRVTMQQVPCLCTPVLQMDETSGIPPGVMSRC